MWELVHMTNAHPVSSSTTPHQRCVELSRVMTELCPTLGSRLAPPSKEELEAYLKPLESWPSVGDTNKMAIIRAFRLSSFLQITLRRVSLLATAVMISFVEADHL